MKEKQNKLTQKKADEEKITRKEALVKAGKYAAFTAAATLFVLTPKLSQAGSTEPEPPPAWSSPKW